MTKPVIFFAHGNGFPSLCYQKIFSFLQKDFEIQYPEMLGHHPDYPVNENWDTLVEELITCIRETNKAPVIGVGHSLGGILMLRASIYHPELFKAVILLDSPLLGHVKSQLVRLAKKLGMIHLITPSERAKKRKQHWQNLDEAFTYCRHKLLFKNFDLDCLGHYIKYGLKETDQGYELRFKSEVEAKVFQTLPHILPRYHKKLSVPTACIYGEKSRVVSTMDIKNMVKNYSIHCYSMKGGHMFPMEYPVETADKIRQVIKTLS